MNLAGMWEGGSPPALVHFHASGCGALHYRRVPPWASVLTGAISPSQGHPGASGWHSVAWFPLGLAWLSGKCRSAESRLLAAKLPVREGCGRSPALSNGRSKCPPPADSLRISSMQLEQQAFKPAVLRRVFRFWTGSFSVKSHCADITSHQIQLRERASMTHPERHSMNGEISRVVPIRVLVADLALGG